jgi:hypothetical protein
MGKVIVVIILYVFLSALLRLESKLIVAACRDASVIRGIFGTNSELYRHRSKKSIGPMLGEGLLCKLVWPANPMLRMRVRPKQYGIRNRPKFWEVYNVLVCLGSRKY